MARDDVAVQDGASLAGREREVYVGRMFDRIATPYDRLNRVISLGRDRRWRALAIEAGGVTAGATVVDLGCGTGDFILAALPALQGRGRVIGVDLSPNMIAIAREKTAAHPGGVEIDLGTGNAASTGLPDGIADVVTMGWVVRNLGDRPAAYAEILRILKPGGRFACLEVSRPASAFLNGAFKLYMHGVMPLMMRIFGGDRDAYRYLADSSARFLDPAELAAEMRAAGFASVTFRRLMAGAMAIHVAVKAR